MGKRGESQGSSSVGAGTTGEAAAESGVPAGASGHSGAAAGGSKFTARTWWLLAALVVAVLAAYSPVRLAGFIWDDDAHVTTNPVIIGPLGLKEIWTSAKANYFPLTMTSFWVQHALWGLNPLPYHVVCVGLQALCAVLLFLVLTRLRVPGAAIGAGLWALHPVQVESVAWISELKNTQACTFFLLAVWFFLRWLRPAAEPGWTRDYGLALGCAVLAILSKTSTVMLPVVLGLVWWWVGGLSWRRAAWLLPFLAVSLLASGWTIWEQKVNSMASGPDWHQPLPERLILAGRVVWFYLGKLAWPHPLIYIYPRWTLDATVLIAWLPLAALAVVAAGLTWRRNGPARPWFLAGAYFVVSLFPVLGFFDVFYFRYSFVADHFQHLASIGPLALAGAGLARLRQVLPAGAAAWRTAVAVVPLVVLGVMSWRQCAIYRDADVLWSDTATRNPRAWIAHVNLGVQLVAAGKYEEALAHYRTALELRPGAAEIQTNLGGALLHLGRPAEAIPLLEAATRSKPEMLEAHNCLGLALAGVGRLPEAERAYAAALRLKPDASVTLFNLANLLVQLGRMPEALAKLEIAVRQTMDSGQRETIHRRLGEWLIASGRVAEGVGHYEIVLRMNPGDGATRYLLATHLFQLGRPADAVPQFEEVLRQQPALAEGHNNLGSALVQLGRLDQAIAHYREAVRLRPDFADAHGNLGLAFARAGRLPEAVASCERALQVAPNHSLASRLLAEIKAAAPSSQRGAAPDR